MNVVDLMTKTVVTAHEDDSLITASRKLKENRIKHLPIVNNAGVPTGIVTDRDIKRASASDATSLEVHELLYLLQKLQVASFMTKKPITAGPELKVSAAAGLMVKHDIGCLPVVKEKKLVGILTTTDLLKYCASGKD